MDALVQSSTAREFRAELPLKRGDGQWAWVEIFGVPIRSDSLSGETAQAAEDWLFVARDIGEERQARERLARAQRLEGISILAAGLAHDFNNLLVVINGYAELLPESAEKAAILQASGEAASLTSSLMTFGRRLEPASGSTDLCAAIEKWRPMISRVLGARRELNVILPSRPVRCRLGDGQFNQIILNLVTNARQAMEEGGSLTIVVDVLESPPENALVRGLAPGVYGRLTVRDTGRGMDAEVLANALDPFFTTHSSEGGSGVGLASVNAIVHDCGGSLDLDSVPGNGTRVVVYLPLAASAADGSGTESVGAGTSAHAALPVTSESSEPG